MTTHTTPPSTQAAEPMLWGTNLAPPYEPIVSRIPHSGWEALYTAPPSTQAGASNYTLRGVEDENEALRQTAEKMRVKYERVMAHLGDVTDAAERLITRGDHNYAHVFAARELLDEYDVASGKGEPGRAD